jgi:DNA mismatch repair protein MutS
VVLPPDGEEAAWTEAIPGHRRIAEPWQTDLARAADALGRHFAIGGLQALGLGERPAATVAAGMILAHVEHADPSLLAALSGLRVTPPEGRVGLDAATRRNLEITRSLGTGGARGSLLGVLDTTKTAMGARALRRLIGDPLRDLDLLLARQRVIGALAASGEWRATLGFLLTAAGDLERLAARVASGGASVRDLLALAEALRQADPVCDLLGALPGDAAARCAEIAFDPCGEALALLDEAVEPDAERVARIRAGFAPDLDRAVEDAAVTRRWLAGLEGRERERTGIRSLKVGYTKVFGYYIEVTRPNLGLVPPEYTRKQTVAGGERFITADLKEAEARLAAADEEIAGLERLAIERACGMVRERLPALQRMARALALVDALLALAEVAARHGWTAPTLTDDDVLEIAGGRHPVVEASLAGAPFIPNDVRLGGGAHPRLLLVTGPNMGGKSTYLRQAGLIVLLAQVGSFVPAASARIGLVDRIFTRVGAQDDLARGHSTFMTEMVETAAILHGATSRSLLLLDEIGRGTSTGDGLAIARAVVEEVAETIRARCLFATHYLELTMLADLLPGVANAHVGALETGGKVVFLYSVAPGPADRAYGVQVARLAGLPPAVADRAAALLARWETGQRPTGSSAMYAAETTGAYDAGDVSGSPDSGNTPHAGNPGPDPGMQSALDLAEALRALDLDGLTPREALAWLWSQRDRLDAESRPNT